jgi:hypothetical protein
MCLLSTGCVSHITRISASCDAVPANRLPLEVLCESREGKVPIDFTRLRQQPPSEYIIGPKDLLAVYVEDLLPPKPIEDVIPRKLDDAPGKLPEPPAKKRKLVFFPEGNLASNYYPPLAVTRTPFAGVPLSVNADGDLPLPLLNATHVAGLTLQQASEMIRKAYSQDRRILQPGHDRVTVSLVRSRVQRVLVIREDTNFPNFVYAHARARTKRGTAQIVDLPAFENDVLHALIVSGGLPGIDAHNSVWVLRSRAADMADVEPAVQRIRNGEDPRDMLEAAKMARTYLHIPLRVWPGEVLPITEKDILLRDGDVVYLQSRDNEIFLTGGLLPPGQFLLPRDHDLDVMEAIAFAQGSVGGMPGANYALNINYREGLLGGMIDPTEVVILRQLPNNAQMKIRVDLNRAAKDTEERILIQPNDVVMLQYKPAEFIGNAALGIARVNVVFFNNRQKSASASQGTGTGGGTNPGNPGNPGNSP